MAGATPKLIKELREMTGAGMLDCKNALNETDGDLEKAVQALRESGLGKAAKKAGNIAAEGVVAVKVNADNTIATLLELNAQTDFVAKNENFLNLTQEIVTHAQVNDIADAEALAASTINGISFPDFLNGKIATIGENLVARKLVSVTGTVVNGYVHTNGRVGVLLAATCDASVTEKASTLLKSLAMHASASAILLSCTCVTISCVKLRKFSFLATKSVCAFNSSIVATVLSALTLTAITPSAATFPAFLAAFPSPASLKA